MISDPQHEGVLNGGALAQEILSEYVAALAATSERPGASVERLVRLGEVFELVGQALAASPAAFVVRRLLRHDADTVAHSVNVMRLGLALAEQADADGIVVGDIDTLVDFGLGLLLHDVGKLRVRVDVLTKPGRLTSVEADEMVAHPLHGAELLADAGLSALSRAVVRSHHERWDGGGYPDGLRGERIDPFVQLAAMADVYDAVGAERPYRPAGGERRARAAIARASGMAFSEEMAAVFTRTFTNDADLDPPEPPLAEVVQLRPLLARSGACDSAAVNDIDLAGRRRS